MSDEHELEFWDSKPFIDAANILVAADEPLRAISLLENLPAGYRDHIPRDIFELKERILGSIATSTFYSQNESPIIPIEECINRMEGALRWELIKKDVLDLNEKSVLPHIIDLGPGEYWLPFCLDKIGAKFTYEDIPLNQGFRGEVLNLIPHVFKKREHEQPVIFFACELIEHLHHESDLAAELNSMNVKAEIIHVSTPKYTFDTRKERLNWENYGKLGHLRTYTPSEFFTTIIRMFPAYKFSFYDSKILHARGVRNGQN